MKILEFLEEKSGQLSSKRLFTFLVIVSTIIDWQHAIWTVGRWTPDLNVIGLILGVVGFQVVGKFAENGEPNANPKPPTP